ncbi:MAG TPA: HEAT repeat domain-containing protein [Candidatus Competibacteraceae bacterium]|nr:HEAT repeat domain-containing protein [Candidatus Competibacteraceae bacterium]HRZ04958.1 HEAT repeat domain-containing protein [Candidatus Competibacteraceae bacterium]HSA46020.1 HEAT repeat domain-containing protein [Candidatus Competibacteraceae bacterium]
MNDWARSFLPLLGMTLLLTLQLSRGIAMNDDIAAQVNTAFAAARQENYELISQLAEQGAQIIPYLKPYLQDDNEMVRQQAAALLTASNDPAAIPLLALALRDPLQDIRARAALALYEQHDPVQWAKRPEVGEALRASVDQGNDAAAALLLLGYFPGEPTLKALKDLRKRAGDAQTELATWAPVVPVNLAIAVSLSRLGDQAGRLMLLQTSAEGSLAEREFLLSVLRELDSPEVLHALAAGTLSDVSEIGGGVPSGVQPQRRLCDLAVVSFVKRLNLPVNFTVNDQRRFTPAEIDVVRQTIAGSLPRG